MLTIGILSSKRAPGLDALLRHPARGRMFEIACVVTSEASLAGSEAIEAAGVPVIAHPIRRAPTRRDYDAATAELLNAAGVDTIVLLGYVYILTDKMLDVFPDRILNVHDSDLTLTGANGERRYVGLHSTRDAVSAGERETRSSVHLVTPKVDAGPVLVLSGSYPVAPFASAAARGGHTDIVKVYAYAQREWMMRDGWGSLVIRALESIAAGADEDDVTVVSRMAMA